MSDLDVLLASIVGDDEWSRHHVLEELRRKGASPDEVRRLATALESDDASRRSAARMALAALASPSSRTAPGALGVLVERLRSSDPDLRVLAASALGEAGNPGAGAPLVAALGDPEPNVVAAAADSLGRLRYAPALDALAAAASSESFWVRAAAVVALGQLEDERALPALAHVARNPGLERPLVEAIRRINHPAGLDVLASIRATAPLDAVVAAGALLAAHPDVEPPGWVVQAAEQEAEALRVMLVEDDDPALARVLGIAATPSAIDTLVALVGPPRRSEAAITGLLAVRPDRRSAVLIDQLADADRETRVSLLPLLPPLTEPAHVRALLPLLSDADPTVRAETAEALGRAPAPAAFSLLESRLAHGDVTPEVVRALGGLGDFACVALLPLLEDRTPAVRAAAADALVRCARPDVPEALARTLETEDQPAVRRALLRSLGRTGGGGRIRALVEALDDADTETRLAAIEGLGASGAPEAVEPLERALDGAPHETLAAIRALGELEHPATVPVLERFLGDSDLDRRRAAARAAVAVAAELAASTVEALEEDADDWVRVFAARMLGRRGEPGRSRLSRMAADDPSPTVRTEARRALAPKE